MPRNENYQCEYYYPTNYICGDEYGISHAKCNGDMRRCTFNERRDEAMTNFINNIEQANVNISRAALIKKLREVNGQNEEKIPDWVWFVINSMESVKNGNTKKR